MPNSYNLVGNPIEDAVIQQINMRARMQSSDVVGAQSEQQVAFKSRKNAFVKLSSFIQVTNESLAKVLGDGGIELARKWTLFNGVNVGNGHDYNLLGLKGYGQGGTSELGYRPMPGITGATITPAGQGGSIRRATVNFKCHNLQQLNIIDILYFRLGFSMLLEWGHNNYVDNKGNLQIQNYPIDLFPKDENLSKEKIIQELAQKRKSSLGNYDGMLGVVTNYNWSLSGDGGYECSINLSGIGSIIESLKINSSEASPSVVVSTEEESKAKSEVTPSQQNANNVSSALAKTLMLWKAQAIKSKDKEIDAYIGYAFKSGLNLWRNPTDEFKKGFNSSYMEGLKENVPEVDFKKLGTIFYSTLKSTDDEKSEFVYMPLGLLLAYLNNSCTAYNEDTAGKVPFVYIDFNPETNFCFTMPQQFSIDPTVCLIENRSTDETIDSLFTIRGVKPESITKKFTAAQNRLSIKIIRSRDRLGDYIDYSDERGPRGKIMNILVNIDHVLTLLEESKDGKENVYLSPFLTSLMDNIGNALGAVNVFRVGYDDESNVVRIYDEQLVANKDTDFPTIPVFGVNSIARKMTLQTEASTNIGSMIAINAMAGERTPIPENKDVSAYAYINSRVKDRLTGPRDQSPNKNSQGESEDIAGLTSLADIFNAHLINIYYRGKFDKLAIANCLNYYMQSMNALKSINKGKEGDLYRSEDSSVARGFLPLKLTLELDGISNIRKYQGFLIPANRLPGQYKEDETTVNVGFIVSDLTHVIQGQNWILNLGGQMVIKPGAKTKTLGYSNLEGSAQAFETISPVMNTTPPSSVSKLGFGLPVSLPYLITSFIGRAQSKTYNKKTDAKTTHFGIDILGPSLGVRNTQLSNEVGGQGTTGDIVFSVGDGRVLVSGPVGGYGYAVYILHQIGSQVYTSIYGHMPLASIKVKAGELVQKGTPLALIGNEGGSTGPHLHFELWKGERRGPSSSGTELCDPLDYLPFFAANGGVISGDVAYKQVKYGGSTPSPKVFRQGTGESVKRIEPKPIITSTKDINKF
jgi:hypothetical protein